jgi:uncharacterized protein
MMTGLAFRPLPLLFSQALPRSQGFVNDFAAVMQPADIQKLETLTAAVRQKTGAELGIAAVRSFAPYGSIEEYALALYNGWGIGGKGKDEGVLLVLAVEERKVKIEVGYGLEGAIPDGAAGRILDTAVLPDFREGDFSGGLVKGAQALAALIAKEKGLDAGDFDLPAEVSAPSNAANSGGNSAQYAAVFIIGWFLLVILVFAFGVVSNKAGRGGRSGGSSGYRSRSSSHRSGFSGGGRSGGGGASRGF